MNASGELRYGGLGLVLLTAALGAMACNPTPLRSEFDADTLYYGSCSADVVPWEPAFATIDRFEDQVTIRLQSRAGSVRDIDGLFIQVDSEYVASNVNKPLLMGLPDANGQLPVRGLLGFYESCPSSTVVPELVGTIRFSFFEPRNDGQITADIIAPAVIDSRTGDVIGANFTGRFSFRVQKGRPYTNFTGPGQE